MPKENPVNTITIIVQGLNTISPRQGTDIAQAIQARLGYDPEEVLFACATVEDAVADTPARLTITRTVLVEHLRTCYEWSRSAVAVAADVARRVLAQATDHTINLVYIPDQNEQARMTGEWPAIVLGVAEPTPVLVPGTKLPPPPKGAGFVSCFPTVAGATEWFDIIARELNDRDVKIRPVICAYPSNVMTDWVGVYVVATDDSDESTKLTLSWTGGYYLGFVIGLLRARREAASIPLPVVAPVTDNASPCRDCGKKDPAFLLAGDVPWCGCETQSEREVDARYQSVGEVEP